MTLKLLRHGLRTAALAALLCGANAAAGDSAAVASTGDAGEGPLLWRVDGEGGDLYLLGSVHLLTKADYPLPAAADRAYAEAEELMFELSPEAMRSGEIGAKMMRLGSLPAGETLKDHVSASTWQAVQAYLDGGGYLPLSAVERMQPWFLALTLSVMEMQRLGMDPSLGVEQHFMRMLDSDGKPALGLETVDQQLALFSGLSAEEQDQQLRQSLEQMPEMRADLDRMLQLWRSGDGEGLDRLMREEMAEFPALYERLIVERNRDWIAPLEAQLADAGDELVVVGAAHLVGPQGVVAMLRARGHAVERMSR